MHITAEIFKIIQYLKIEKNRKLKKKKIRKTVQQVNELTLKMYKIISFRQVYDYYKRCPTIPPDFFVFPFTRNSTHYCHQKARRKRCV